MVDPCLCHVLQYRNAMVTENVLNSNTQQIHIRILNRLYTYFSLVQFIILFNCLLVANKLLLHFFFVFVCMF